MTDTVTSETDSAAEEFNLSSSYSENLPAILSALHCSLILTSYQSSRVIVVRTDGREIDTHFVPFPRPMGLAVQQDRIVMGVFAQILDYRRVNLVLEQSFKGEDGERISPYDKRADVCFVPRASHVTGMINIHDIGWGDQGLWVVNSTFSCLSTIGPDFSFVPQWKPPFISTLAPEDRCHLNGMAMKDGKPAYVTTFDQSDTKRAWRERRNADGTVIDVAKDKIICTGLLMPHSPRWYRGALYVCESGNGMVWRIDPATGVKTEVVRLPGFTRGMAFFGPLLVVGLSKARHSDVKTAMTIVEDETCCGLCFFNIEENEIVATLNFEGDVAQIYDVAILDEACWPELVGWDSPVVKDIYDYPILRQ